MFLKMTAPTVPLTPAWQSFMDESIKEYLKVHPGSTFAHERKEVNRMPITSMTAQQLIRGDESKLTELLVYTLNGKLLFYNHVSQ